MYAVIEDDLECDGFAVVSDAGELMGCHDTPEEAEAQLAELMAAEPAPEETPSEDAVVMSTIALAEIPVSDDLAPWEGLIAVEGVETGDGRFLMEEALTWRDLPLPLMMMTENPVGGEGHDGAKLVGRIDGLERRGVEIWGVGVIDLGSEHGAEANRLLGKKMIRGVSADIDKVVWDSDASADPLEALMAGSKVAEGRVMGATLTSFPALSECEIWLSGAGPSYPRAQQALADGADALAASAGGYPTRIAWYTPLSGRGGALVASGGGKYPVVPPAAWMRDQELKEYTPLTITDDGHYFGHAVQWGALHIGMSRPTPVPRSALNYSAFRVGAVKADDGKDYRTGPIVMDTVHPDLRMQASDTQAFYAHTGCAVADVTIGEDRFGIWISGAIRPGTTDEQIRVLRASDLSPDWRTVNGKPREVVGMLVVNNSGFKPLSALVASGGEIDEAGNWIMPGRTAARIEGGEVMALVASGAATRGSVLDEIGVLRAELSQLRTLVRPALADRARARAVELAGSRTRHPAGEVTQLTAVRRDLARATARRLSKK